ncbi:PREDICTED: protein OSB4, chloroplastic [Tarenaya hassleriana]|uniref:protein OSB4, chloroplastic n=1 Tax=Tarenaya hassleriana TaxID=28532 RepID=UPI00053C4337|nr:PREDICTED: protein OSB4, chloroplastic [Tarenaya hassleriana]
MHFVARSLTRTLKSSSLTTIKRSRVLSQQFHSTICTNSGSSRGRSSSTNSGSPEPAKAPATETEWPRPKEIPYQPKVANSVNLIGYVNQPVQFEASSDGKFWAGTVVSHGSSSDSSSVSDSDHNLWIPVIFEGDLARTAACHLKKDDRIHIAGQLFVDILPSGANLGQANVQVMVQSLHFVDNSLATKAFAMSDQEGVLKHSANVTRFGGVGAERWHDLLHNPEEWWDYRENKQNGMVNPKHPDFKKKDGSLALWLNTAPKWVLSDLEGVKFDTPVSKPRQVKQDNGGESWTDLLANPSNWWDNRLDKKHPRSPDFKHKETGVSLWLSDSPSWVLPKLPPLKGKAAAASEKDDTWISLDMN